MMLMCGQSNRIWHYWCGRYPGSVGLLVGPSYLKKVPIDPWMPFALDNDAFTAWKDNKPWDEGAWFRMLEEIKMRGLKPNWVAIPDVVGNKEKTLAKWTMYARAVMDRGWPLAFCVQDGMTPVDVPLRADVIFVGGTDGWKFPNLPMWTASFPRVHCARVTSQKMIEACEKLGCESVDGTGWFRAPDRPDHLPMLKRFIEGHRDNHAELFGELRCDALAEKAQANL